MILSDIPFELDTRALFARLRLDPEDDYSKELLEVARAAEKLARPKAIYLEAFVEGRGEETVTVNGVTFTSRVLRANLSEVERVFPYIATCGPEMDRTPLPEGDVMAEFCRDTVKEMALAVARTHLIAHLKERYGVPRLAAMNPGSGDKQVWRIEQQQPLFSLFGDVEAQIGVRLTPSCLMHPNKTISGIFYAAEMDWITCRLCHREGCPGRRAPFDPELWREKMEATA